MSNSPNKEYRDEKNLSLSYYGRGDNLVYRKNRAAFEILLTREYYEGTEFGLYYNTFSKDEEGNEISDIYIRQPEIERVIKNEIIENDSDMLKYLVGYTGIGKTTLLRNVFNVFNRNINEFDNNLVIYISFYSMSADDRDYIESVHNMVKSALDMSITYLSGYRTRTERIAHEDNDYYIKFYNFLEDNNPAFAASINDIDLFDKLRKAECAEKDFMWELYNISPMDYLLTLMKYYLSRKNNRRFRNVIIIFDDLESQPNKCIKEILKIGNHIRKCLIGLGNRNYRIKQIISVRDYSFRSLNKMIVNEGNRIDFSEVIIKSEIPSLSQIIKARMKVVLKKIENNSFNQSTTLQLNNSIRTAYSSLEFILNRLYSQYDLMILNLTQYNLLNSMSLLIRIVSSNKNSEQIENEYLESVGIKSYEYGIENKPSNSVYPRDIDVFFALAYGNEKVYIDSKNYYLTNILHYHSNENVDTELLGVYIIQYMLMNNLFASGHIIDRTISSNTGSVNSNYQLVSPLYTIESTALIDELSKLYKKADDITYNRIEEGFRLMVEHLYNGGVLLEDITNDGTAVEKNILNLEGAKVYLSSRGRQLYNMLKLSSLLLEVYRDDIDTDLKNNNVLTIELPEKDRIDYCLDYVDHLSVSEQMLLSYVDNIQAYIEKLGDELAVYIIMEGLRSSIVAYFSDDNQNKLSIVSKYNYLTNKINDSIGLINEKYNVRFKLIANID